MSKVVIFGTGRGADVAFRYLCGDTDHEVVGFTVESQYFSGGTFHGLPIVPYNLVVDFYPPHEFSLFALLGYQGLNSLRARVYESGKTMGYSFISYVSSDIFRIDDIKVGENCFILDNQSINLDVEIGNNVVMWSSNHIGDLTRIEDHAWISSHCTVAANVVVGRSCFLGIGATVSNSVTLGESSFLGANALATESLPCNGVLLAGSTGRVNCDSKVFFEILEITGKI